MDAPLGDGDVTVPRCRVCASPLEEEAFRLPGYAVHRPCRVCLYLPGFDAADRCISYAEWGDRWVRAFPAMAGERELKRKRAEELFPRTWAVGDLLSVPVQDGGVALGQIVWLHPRHYRLHVIVERELRVELPSGQSAPPRADLLVRTADWALMHGLWRVVGRAPVPDEIAFPQLLAKVDDAAFAVDPVNGTLRGHVDIQPTTPTIEECAPVMAIAKALAAGPERVRPWARYMYSRSLEDARRGMVPWRNPRDPLPGLASAASPDPQAQWAQGLPPGKLRILPTRSMGPVGIGPDYPPLG